MKVNAISNYNFKNIHFESKKNTEIQKPVHASNPIKAIPLAVLLAMSPLNTPAQTQTKPTQAEYTQYTDNNALTGKYYNKGVTPKGVHCQMTVFDNEDKHKSVVLNLTQKIGSYAIDTNRNVVDAYRIKEVELIPEKLYSKTEIVNFVNGKKEVNTKYYVIGSGTEYTSVPMVNDTSVVLKQGTNTTVFDVNQERYEINESMYNSLKEILKDQIPVDEEASTIYTTRR